MNNKKSLAVVLVTYNRRQDLEKTVGALLDMRSEYDHLVVVDNDSADSTADYLSQLVTADPSALHVVRMPNNLGGAGGFNAGVNYALQLDVDWIWCSDDDAIPQPGALRSLLDSASNPQDAYGSVAIAKGSDNETLCWPAPVLKDGRRSGAPIAQRSDLDPQNNVKMLPFLGMMFSTQTVRKIGLPNRCYFISGDDVEYCIRIKSEGGRLWQIRDSVVIHPAIPRYIVNFLGWKFYCLEMAPWRRYYDCRNRIWNALLSGGIPWACLTTVSMIMRLGFTLIYEKQRQGQVAATFRGIWHGWVDYRNSRLSENFAAG